MSRSLCFVSAAALVALLTAGSANAAGSADPSVVPCAAANGSAKASSFRYPVSAQKTRRQGSVELRVLVDEAGHASKVVVSGSSGSSELDKAARVAARSTSYCLPDGRTQAAPGYALMRVDFKLDQLVAGR